MKGLNPLENVLLGVVAVLCGLNLVIFTQITSVKDLSINQMNALTECSQEAKALAKEVKQNYNSSHLAQIERDVNFCIGYSITEFECVRFFSTCTRKSQNNEIYTYDCNVAEFVRKMRE